MTKTKVSGSEAVEQRRTHEHWCVLDASRGIAFARCMLKYIYADVVSNINPSLVIANDCQKSTKMGSTPIQRARSMKKKTQVKNRIIKISIHTQAHTPTTSLHTPPTAFHASYVLSSPCSSTHSKHPNTPVPNRAISVMTGTNNVYPLPAPAGANSPESYTTTRLNPGNPPSHPRARRRTGAACRSRCG